jgi:glyoxylase I family protein
MRGIVHHIDLTVRDPWTSFPFYDAFLKALGYRLIKEDDRGFDWKLETEQGSHEVGLVRASPDGRERSHDRFSPGLHHLAWAVDSRAEVDHMHECLLKIGAKVLDPPAEYPQYNAGRGYYAVFFADPDGLKLECVYTPPTPVAGKVPLA